MSLPLEKYFERYNVSPELRPRVIQILEMSAEGCSVNDIKREVRGSSELITETRMKGRRLGVV